MLGPLCFRKVSCCTIFVLCFFLGTTIGSVVLLDFPGTFDCNTESCLHNGVCDKGTGICTCPKPWEGLDCSVCGCKHGGNCSKKEKIMAGEVCSCPKNYDPKSFCSLCTAGHGGPGCLACDCSGDRGSCSSSPTVKQQCQCFPPFEGAKCQLCGCYNGGRCINITQVSKDPLPQNGCMCVNHFTAESGCLACMEGYYKVDGTQPRKNDVCKPCPGGAKTPCAEHGFCTSAGTCTCLDGWSGDSCSVPHSDAYLIPQNIIIFVSVAIGACFVGTVAMAFLVFSRNIQYRSLSDRLRNGTAGTSASDSTGTGSNRRFDDDITRALLRSSFSESGYGSIEDGAPSKSLVGGGTGMVNKQNGAKKNTDFDPVEGWTISLESLNLTTPIATGGSSSVYFGEYAGFPVAVKVLPLRKRGDRAKQKIREEYEQEATLLSQLHHINIVRFYGIAFTSTSVLLVEEFCPFTLQQILIQGHENFEVGKWWWGRLIDVAREIARALAFLHSKSVVHRDLKPDNILLDANGHVKICDFGVARIVGRNRSSMTGQVGTPVYMAPELLLQTNTQEHATPTKIDVYSFGVVLWAMWSRRIPYKHLFIKNSLNTFQLAQQIANGLRPPTVVEKLPPVEDGARDWSVPPLPRAFERLLLCCWAQEPSLRPTFDEIEFTLGDREALLT